MSGQVDAPPGPYPPQAMQQQPQVITQVQYVSAPSFGRNPATLVCPQCQKNITTRTSSEPSTTAWIIGLVLCVIGCVPCCIIPCCMDSMQTVWACLLANHLYSMIFPAFRWLTPVLPATALWAGAWARNRRRTRGRRQSGCVWYIFTQIKLKKMHSSIFSITRYKANVFMNSLNSKTDGVDLFVIFVNFLNFPFLLIKIY